MSFLAVFKHCVLLAVVAVVVAAVATVAGVVVAAVAAVVVLHSCNVCPGKLLRLSLAFSTATVFLGVILTF